MLAAVVRQVTPAYEREVDGTVPRKQRVPGDDRRRVTSGLVAKRARQLLLNVEAYRNRHVEHVLRQLELPREREARVGQVFRLALVQVELLVGQSQRRPNRGSNHLHDLGDVDVLVRVHQVFDPVLVAQPRLGLDLPILLVLLVELLLLFVRLLEVGERASDTPGLVVGARIEVELVQRPIRFEPVWIRREKPLVLCDGLFRLLRLQGVKNSLAD